MKVIAQGVVVHRLQQPVPVVLLHVTYNASSNDSNDSDDDDDDSNKKDKVTTYRIELMM